MLCPTTSKDEAGRREVLKQAMAEAAQKLLSGPEDNAAELKTLLALCGNQDAAIARLGMLSLSAVFKVGAC